jgi:ATP-dependent exoDNAse (exonuclease V) beta subunit
MFKAVGLPFDTWPGEATTAVRKSGTLLNLLRSLYNPADNLSLAAALRSALYSA